MDFRRHALMLAASDVAAAKELYMRLLGLECPIDLGWFVSLVPPAGRPQGFELSLCASDHPSLPRALRRPPAGVVLAFEVDDAERVYGEFRANAAEILLPLTDEPWGQRHFYAAGADGAAIDVFQSIAPDPQWMAEQGLSQ